jgi:hypothetical protein
MTSKTTYIPRISPLLRPKYRGARAGFYGPPLIHTYIHTYIHYLGPSICIKFLFVFSHQTLRYALTQFGKVAILYIVNWKAKEGMASSEMKKGIVWNVYTNISLYKDALNNMVTGYQNL